MKQQLREYLALRYQEDDLRQWFDPLCLNFDEEQKCISVSFPHAFFATWFANGPQNTFLHAVRDFLGQQYHVAFGQGIYGQISREAKHHTHAKLPCQNCQRSTYEPVKTVYTNSPTALDVKNASIGHSARKNSLSSTWSSVYEQGQNTQEASFDSFIVNHKNAFPLTAAREVAVASRLRRYNPVLIGGESGNGKSHLLNAIAHELASAMGPASVYCKSITDIEILYARADKLVVRKHLMQREAFLIDDIHLLCDLPHLHDEIICLFDYFLEHHKQMAFACTGGLRLLQDISPALRSRLELGLILHLKEPDVDVRTRFIHSQCVQMGLKLSRDQSLLLAQRCPSFRHISGILLKISAYVDMVEHNVEDRELEKLLRHAESGRERKLTHKKIIDIVSDHFNLTPADILGDKRHKDIVFARQVAMFLCRELLGCSFPTLGRFFNGKDHSTTMYSVNKINKLQHDNKDTHTLVTELKKRCIGRESDKQ